MSEVHGGRVYCRTESSVQLELTIVDQDKITRLLPGMEDMEINYYRCQI
jgi:hypothetical protein